MSKTLKWGGVERVWTAVYIYGDEDCAQIWFTEEGRDLSPPHIYSDPDSDPSPSALFSIPEATRCLSLTGNNTEGKRDRLRCLKILSFVILNHLL